MLEDHSTSFVLVFKKNKKPLIDTLSSKISDEQEAVKKLGEHISAN